MTKFIIKAGDVFYVMAYNEDQDLVEFITDAGAAKKFDNRNDAVKLLPTLKRIHDGYEYTVVEVEL